jgi:hypothetical protein
MCCSCLAPGEQVRSVGIVCNMLAMIVCHLVINGLREFMALLAGVVCEMQLLFAVCKLHCRIGSAHRSGIYR